MKVNEIFKALSDPTRRKILDMLRYKDMTAGEIAEMFDITKPSISHHLNILKQADLILDERRGQNIYYSLNTTVLEEIISIMLNFFQSGKDGKIEDKKE
ncbi:MAG: autorepressor SdpR family transcription factor [Thermoanaerobacteraceae bacterium]|nr:autorepressor SdpR family transcription factor [Thermoanaerobacteraceae bacterium]